MTEKILLQKESILSWYMDGMVVVHSLIVGRSGAKWHTGWDMFDFARQQER